MLTNQRNVADSKIIRFGNVSMTTPTMNNEVSKLLTIIFCWHTRNVKNLLKSNYENLTYFSKIH